MTFRYLTLTILSVVLGVSTVFAQEYTDDTPTLSVSLSSESPFVYQDSEGYTVVVGIVENNNSQAPVTNVRIQVNFFDDYGSNPLEVIRGYATLEVIAPNGKSTYSIRSQTLNSGITQASAFLLGFDSSAEKQKGLTVYSTDLFLDTSFRFSGVLQNGGAPSSNTKVYLAFYDGFEPSRVLSVSTIELGDVDQNSEVSFEINEEINSRAVGFFLFAESNIFSSDFANIQISSSSVAADRWEPVSIMDQSFGDFSLKQQLENNMTIEEIKCRNNKHVLVERPNEKLACVYPSSAEKLGGSNYDNTSVLKRTFTITDSIWTPPVNSTWNWQLDGTVDTSFDVDVYDLDLFDVDSTTIDIIHNNGSKAICYMSAGSWEDWRPDANQFPPEILGNDYEGWHGEKWLDIRNITVLGPIMENRLDLCAQKGFDAIEPDNIDAFENNSGFPLTYADQLNYNIWLANEAHERGLSIGLKNDFAQVNDLVTYFDWGLTEDCYVYDECSLFSPFITASKAVFQAEYTDEITNTTEFCPESLVLNFSGILKDRELDAPFEACQ